MQGTVYCVYLEDLELEPPRIKVHREESHTHEDVEHGQQRARDEAGDADT